MNIDWATLAQIGVAVGTGALAFSTWKLSRGTDTMASHTKDLATETKRMASAAEEALAYAKAQAESATYQQQMLEQQRKESLTCTVTPTSWSGQHGVRYINHGPSPAQDVAIKVSLARGQIQESREPIPTVPVGPGSYRSFEPNEDESIPDEFEQQRRRGGALALIEWTNADGSRKSSGWLPIGREH